MQKLQGLRGMKTYREMGDNDATVGATLFAVEMTLRNVDWLVNPFSELPEHKDQAEAVRSMTEDMDETWEDFIAEALTMVQFGFELSEIVLKYRVGPEETDPARKSKYSDGLVGIRSLSPRAQDTIDRWEWDDQDRLLGAWQRDPFAKGSTDVFLPIEKLLHFRTTSRKNNPEGVSALRRSYRSWYFKKHVEESEAIGIERDLAGIPTVEYPAAWATPDATDGQKATVAAWEELLKRVKLDEQAGIGIPQTYDDKGNPQVKFSLLGTMARRQHDTTAVIGRYDHAIARTMLADFIMLGQAQVGSYALADSKTSLFGIVLGAWLKAVAAVLNRVLIPLIYRVNGWDLAEACWFEPGDLDQRDLAQFAEAVAKLTMAGFLIPGGKATEAMIRDVVGLPQEDEDPIAVPPAAALPSASAEPGQIEGARLPVPETAKDPAQALNGAQVQAMVDLVAQVVTGEVPRSSAVGILVTGFPLTREQAEGIVGEAGRVQSPAPAPAPATPPIPGA